MSDFQQKTAPWVSLPFQAECTRPSRNAHYSWGAVPSEKEQEAEPKPASASLHTHVASGLAAKIASSAPPSPLGSLPSSYKAVSYQELME